MYLGDKKEPEMDVTNTVNILVNSSNSTKVELTSDKAERSTLNRAKAL